MDARTSSSRHRFHALLASTALAAGVTAGCDQPAPQPSAATSAAPTSSAAVAAPVKVTLLYTADENGFVLPEKKDGKSVGGAAELLGAWLAKENHCTGPQGIAKPCDKEKTLVLSGGDSFSGSPISTVFHGDSMAEVMGALGYVATAFGNKDLDFGREQFAKNRDAAKLTYLGANVEVQNPEWKNLEMKPYLIVPREGAKIGVIGLTSPTNKARAMADRFYGLEFKPIEEALSATVPAVWKAGADAVVVIAHECPDQLKPMLEKHPDWKISFVGGANCAKSFDERAAGAVLMAPDKRLRQYARATLTIDLSKPQKERVTGVEAKAIDVVDAPAEPKVAELVDRCGQVEEEARPVARGGDRVHREGSRRRHGEQAADHAGLARAAQGRRGPHQQEGCRGAACRRDHQGERLRDDALRQQRAPPGREGGRSAGGAGEPRGRGLRRDAAGQDLEDRREAARSGGDLQGRDGGVPVLRR
nr:hypothetical protein [Chondromyces crocatus]